MLVKTWRWGVTIIEISMAVPQKTKNRIKLKIA
jgi:hypothetical protein